MPARPGSPVRDPRGFGFQDLLRHRVHDVVLVATPYESFILAEDGQPHAELLKEFLELEIRHVPRFRHVTTGAAALDLCHGRTRPSLLIASMHVADMNAAELARRVRDSGAGVPVVLLAYDNQALSVFQRRHDLSAIDRAFLWQGDARIFLAIVKYVEDRLNAPHDTGTMGVQAILVVEDSVRYYSSFLPAIYAEVIEQARKLLPEGLNLAHKLLRVQARPKILLASSYEEAEARFSDYRENILGIISDVEFPLEGKPSPEAGVRFARSVHEREPDVPILLHSRNPRHRAAAAQVGASFLAKGSPRMLEELRELMCEYFSFGDFVFRRPGGEEVGRAADLRALEELVRTVPADSLAYHAERHHFSRWLKARTEFALAQRLRARKVSDYPSIEALRQDLVRELGEYRSERRRSTIADFSAQSFDASIGLTRLGGGSLGGKARGLAFMSQLLGDSGLVGRWPSVRVRVPAALVLGTDVFDEFLADEELRDAAMGPASDEEIARRFAAAPFPPRVRTDLAAWLSVVREPLAVRSSSLLEDSQYLPFAGVYETRMIANDAPDVETRTERLVRAIKRVWGSTFTRRAKAWLEATGYRLEEEKMAVVIQGLVGAWHGRRFYPDFAGVARSHNFYPMPPMSAQDGVAAVALGFGATVVDGETCLRFCPRYPRNVPPFSSAGDALRNSQRAFFALEVGNGGDGEGEGLRSFALDVAEQDGTLATLGSTWSADNDALYDGIERPGIRLVTFAGVLKHDRFPLAGLLDDLLQLGVEGIGAPVEIEFAVNLSVPRATPPELAFLQLRPLARTREPEDVRPGETVAGRVLCRSRSVLGHGRVEDVRDIVVVDFHRFERGRSREAAAEVGRLNAELAARGRPYLLIGVGRWGSSEPLLGIPVGWEQIAGARAIVEAGFRDFRVTPSQGSHFFQNLSATGTGYFTVNPELGEGELDWDWLGAREARSERDSVRHLELACPLVIHVDGRRGEGVIYAPEET